MATKFEDMVNNMVNIGFGVAATAAEKGKEVFDDLSAKGAAARDDASQTDFGRSMADIFEQAGGAFHDVTDRLGGSGSGLAERVLDELILARVRPMTKSERVEFMARVRDLVDSVDDKTIEVEVEVDAPEGDVADAVDAEEEAAAEDVETAK